MTKEEIKAIRKSLGMTQAEFARELGMSKKKGGQVNISNMERGIYPVSGPTAAASWMLIELKILKDQKIN